MIEIPNGFFIDYAYFDVYRSKLSPLAFVCGLLIFRHYSDPKEDKGIKLEQIVEIVNSFKSKNRSIDDISKAIQELVDNDLIESYYNKFIPKTA